MKHFEKAEMLVEALREKNCTLSFAESCTGGLAAATVVAVPGASAVFYGGIVSYDNSVKENLLSVERRVLQTVGAVSAECAMQMAKGARISLCTDIAVSVTGIAGPDGGTEEKPVGTVYLGIDSARGTRYIRHALGERGDRTAIREASVGAMLDAVAEELLNL